MRARALVRRLAPVAAWAAILLLAALSLLPKDEIVRTGVDGRLEHLVAYAGTMSVSAIAYRERFGLIRPAAALIVYAAVLELAQGLSPGRTPALFDFAAGAAGVIAAALAFAASSAIRR